MVILKGSGHFAIGFVIGYIAFVVLKKLFDSNWNIKIWGPFFPLLLGSYASLPYILEVISGIDNQYMVDWKMNVFLFYSFFHHNKYLVYFFNRFSISILIVCFFYGLLIVYYINLIKKLKQNAK